MMIRAHSKPTSPTGGMSRRGFLRVTGGTAAGLVVGFGLPATTNTTAGAATAEAASFSPFVRIAPDGMVTVIVKHLDKGQGSYSALATLVAEELEADWLKVSAEFAPADAGRYNNLFWGPIQGTGGSTSVANSFVQYRTAGAAAREMLVSAAARQWGVPAGEITVADGVLSHASGRSAGFGELAAAAAGEPVPEKPKLKSADQFKLIGNPSHRRKDTAHKTVGKLTYTQDIQLPGMLVAVIARPPRFGGTVVGFDGTAARAVRDVVDVVQVPRGVAVLANNTWAAMKGRDALQISWDESGAEKRSSDELLAEYRELAGKPGIVAEHGDAETALAGAVKVVEADFEFPYLAHATMEPMNAVAHFKPGESLEVWTGSQFQSGDLGWAAGVSGLPKEKVQIHTVFAGGSFGRRANPSSDYVSEAVSIAVAIKGRAPVKLVWSREDDIKGGYYRPMYVHRVRAGLDDKGNIVAWHHRIVGQSILAGTPFEGTIKDGIDYTSVEGARELPYAVGAHRLELHTTKVGVPVLWWRSVGSTHTAYAVETMMDRLARAAGEDPVAFRLRHIINAPREAAVLELAAEKAGWSKPVADGVFRGVAVHKSFGSYVAQVAEVRLDSNGRMKVERVVCAVDCGIAVTPDQVVSQMEGGLGYGLDAALRGRITLKDGRVEQSQFYDYQPLRITDMPIVETHIMPSSEKPTGAGEPGTPPIAPAVANAVLAATGKTIDSLPFSQHGLV